MKTATHKESGRNFKVMAHHYDFFTGEWILTLDIAGNPVNVEPENYTVRKVAENAS